VSRKGVKEGRKEKIFYITNVTTMSIFFSPEVCMCGELNVQPHVRHTYCPVRDPWFVFHHNTPRGSSLNTGGLVVVYFDHRSYVVRLFIDTQKTD
jgi:hypothetical protein